MVWLSACMCLGCWCWSAGRRPNPRGEGVHFGPDVTEDFLRENNLNMVVRSHECVPL